MTPKQELFAQAYLETSNASEAYKRAYNTQANANDDLLQELEQSRLLALENIQCSAAVTATMSKAKLLGLDKVTATDSPMTAFIASLQSSSVQVVQHCDDDNYEDEEN